MGKKATGNVVYDGNKLIGVSKSLAPETRLMVNLQYHSNSNGNNGSSQTKATATTSNSNRSSNSTAKSKANDNISVSLIPSDTPPRQHEHFLQKPNQQMLRSQVMTRKAQKVWQQGRELRLIDPNNRIWRQPQYASFLCARQEADRRGDKEYQTRSESPSRPRTRPLRPNPTLQRSAIATMVCKVKRELVEEKDAELTENTNALQLVVYGGRHDRWLEQMRFNHPCAPVPETEHEARRGSANGRKKKFHVLQEKNRARARDRSQLRKFELAVATPDIHALPPLKLFISQSPCSGPSNPKFPSSS